MSNRRARSDRHRDPYARATTSFTVDARELDIDALARYIPITDAQRVALGGLEWSVIELPDFARRDPGDPGNMFFSAHVRYPMALYVYASDIWHAAAPAPDAKPDPDHIALIWDARLDDVNAGNGLAVPCTVPGASGLVLKLRAMSEGSSPDWPVERGDRVFITLSPTRAAHRSLAEVDRLAGEAPDRLERLIRKAGSVDAVRRLIEDWSLDKGLADLAHATDALVESVREMQSRATGRPEAELDRVSPADVLAALGASTDVDDEIVSPSEQYTTVVLSILRADVAMSGLLGVDEALLQRPGGLMVRADGHRDEIGAALTTDSWLAMRRDRDYCVKYQAFYLHPASPEYMVELSVEWVGAEVHALCTATRAQAAFDVGIAVFVRFVSADRRTKFPWLMYRYWTRDTDDKIPKRAVLEFTGGHGVSDKRDGVGGTGATMHMPGVGDGFGVETKSPAVKAFMAEVLNLHARWFGIDGPPVPVPGASKRGQA